MCKILKDCPVGVNFWSPLAGVVKFGGIYNNQINVTLGDNTEWYIEPNGKMEMVELTAKSFISTEIMLYPSKDQRDWSKWECPKVKKPRFDPKTLKPFDKILSRNVCDEKWTCDFVSHLSEGKNIYGDVRIYVTGVGNIRRYSIPYNDETKHLVGTSDKAPDFYKYWED